MTCRQYAEAIAWLAARWAEDAEGVPTKTHAHSENVEPDSLLGSPREMPALTRWVDSPFASTRLSDDVFADKLYLRPLAAAFEALRRHPAPWPRETVSPVELLWVLRAEWFDIDVTADRLGLFPDQVHDWSILAIRKLQRNYRATVPARRIDKSEAQQNAEDAA